MRLSTHFSLDELVHPDIIAKVGDRAADFLHPELVPTLEAIRARFGAIAINGIYKGKTFTQSGIRLPDSPIGASLSSHKFGTACDCKFYGDSPQNIQKYIIRNQSEFPYISRMENADVTITWLHIECCSKRQNNIIVFNP